MKLDKKSKKLIKDLYKGRKHIDLTIGILKDGETEVAHWGPDHQVVEGPEVVYAVGSICKPFTTSWMAKDLLKSNRFSYWIFFLIIFVLLAMLGSLFLDDPGDAAILFGTELL